MAAQPDRVDRAVNQKQVLLRQAEVFQKLGADFRRAAVFDLQPDGVARAGGCAVRFPPP